MKKKMIIGVLMAVVMILIFSEPANEENWFMVFFISKLIAFSGGFGVYKLAKKWGV